MVSGAGESRMGQGNAFHATSRKVVFAFSTGLGRGLAWSASLGMLISGVPIPFPAERFAESSIWLVVKEELGS